MYGFIGSSDYFKEVKQFIINYEEELAYKIIGEEIDIKAEIEKIINIKVKHLIIDIAALEKEEEIVQALTYFKENKPKTQIILIIPLRYIPGNIIISELLKINVFDFIRHEIEQGSIYDYLLDHIVHPTPYRKAKNWELEEITNEPVDSKNDKDEFKEDYYKEDYPIHKFEELEEDIEELEEEYEEEYEEKRFFIQPKKVVERTITIIQEKIVGTAVIAFSGTTGRIGTTHVSISIANFLSSKGFKVGVVELHPSKHFEIIRNAYDGIEEYKGYFKLHKTYFYPYQKDLTVTNILQEDFNYLILDMGEYGIGNMEEFYRANKKVIVSGVKEWEIPSLEKILFNEQNIYVNKYLYAFNFADDKAFEFVKSNMGNMACFKLEYNPNLFEMTDETVIAFNTILQDVLPIENKKGNSKLFNFLKRKG